MSTATVFLYVVVSGLIWLRATDGVQHGTQHGTQPGTQARTSSGTLAKLADATVIRVLVAAVIGLHGWQLYRISYPGYPYGMIDFALGHVVSLVAWMTVVLFLLASRARQTLNLGLVVMPSGLLGFLIGWLLPGDPFLLENLPQGIGRHIAIAIPAYGVLSIAFAQATLLWIQENQLRKPNPGSFFPALPALETMETNLFRLTLLGFALLTLNLITGVVTTQQNYGTPLLFNHHILLALLAWGGFGGLLLGRKVFGWRGGINARWTMVAFGILALAYFGTRFVSGVILQN